MVTLTGTDAPIVPLVNRSDSSDEARTDTSSLSPTMTTKTRETKSSADDHVVKVIATVKAGAFSLKGSRKKTDAGTAAKEEEEAEKSNRKHRKYERKTKRFIWPDDLHRLFVAAIFDVGLKNASPKSLLAQMEAAGPDTGLTTEHLKSHLQKYRLNYERSRMQFLEYYEQSAKRNLKRRRCRQAHHRTHAAGSDANTTFVFPISNAKRRKRREGYSDSNGSDSDTGDSKSDDNRMQVDTKGQEAAQRVCAAPISTTEAHPRSLNYSQLMQTVQQQPAANCLQSSIPNGHMTHAVPALASTKMSSTAPQHLPPDYARVQQKQRSDHDGDMVAVSATVAAYPCPSEQLSGSVASGVAGIPELTDPQWSILNSLMSPQLAGMNGLIGGNGLFAQVATSETITRGGNSADGFTLHEGPTNLQVQMHLAMQAQMNLHRQMLTRKVEVAQHLARHSSSMSAMDSSPVSNDQSNPHVPPRDYGESWNNVQQLQHQPYQHHHQRQQGHYQQQLHVMSRPPLSASASNTQLSLATANVQTDTIIAAGISGDAMEIPVPAGSSVSAVTVSDVTGLATETKGGDDGIDLYRWDRIDLNVELDDDDLFGFLKS
uniref:HTH myb-type domain-containing protein n=2 Tax=Hyaloperonospora arabidopsidis (strain Emoy2) TaxID=559515 RepID=M4B8E5_HYAAE